jgi:hypothetical protein
MKGYFAALCNRGQLLAVDFSGSIILVGHAETDDRGLSGGGGLWEISASKMPPA